jgi:type IV secretory pathway VirB4 component
MLRLAKIIKPWSEAGSLNSNINLYGFWDETTFLTKSGDLGMVLKVCGVDFESLDQAGQEFAVKRLEAALKSFGPGFHIYQYLFKTNRPDNHHARTDRACAVRCRLLFRLWVGEHLQTARTCERVEAPNRHHYKLSNA